jgi:hypothetical protein
VERAARRTVALIHHTADADAADIWARALEPHYHVVRFTETTIGVTIDVQTLFLLSRDAFANRELYHLGTLAFHRRLLHVIAHHPLYMAGIWGLRTTDDGALYRDPVVTSVPIFPRSGEFIEDGDHGPAIEEALAALGGWQS